MRQALAQSQAGPWRTSAPRLSRAGTRVTRQMAKLLDQLSRLETWLAQRGRTELHSGDGAILATGFLARLGRDARSVSELGAGSGDRNWPGRS